MPPLESHSYQFRGRGKIDSDNGDSVPEIPFATCLLVKDSALLVPGESGTMIQTEDVYLLSVRVFFFSFFLRFANNCEDSASGNHSRRHCRRACGCEGRGRISARTRARN
jgi:hypothetical protein